MVANTGLMYDALRVYTRPKGCAAKAGRIVGSREQGARPREHGPATATSTGCGHDYEAPNLLAPAAKNKQGSYFQQLLYIASVDQGARRLDTDRIQRANREQEHGGPHLPHSSHSHPFNSTCYHGPPHSSPPRVRRHSESPQSP